MIDCYCEAKAKVMLAMMALMTDCFYILLIYIYVIIIIYYYCLLLLSAQLIVT